MKALGFLYENCDSDSSDGKFVEKKIAQENWRAFVRPGFKVRLNVRACCLRVPRNRLCPKPEIDSVGGCGSKRTICAPTLSFTFLSIHHHLHVRQATSPTGFSTAATESQEASLCRLADHQDPHSSPRCATRLPMFQDREI